MNHLLNSLKNTDSYSLLVFLYVVSAIAFECTPETAIFSTLAIYAIFLFGAVYVLFRRELAVNLYVFALLAFTYDAFIMTLSPTASLGMGAQISYWVLTRTILCLLIFWLSADKLQIIRAILAANIVGSLILTYRVVSIYGGVDHIILIAASGIDARIGRFLINENALGLFLSCGILSCLFFILEGNINRLLRFALFASILVCSIMILLSGSRKSLIFCFLGVTVFQILYYQHISMYKQMWMYILTTCAIAALLFLLQTIPIFATIYARFELLFDVLFRGGNYASDVKRIDMISMGMAEFYESPMFGQGTGRSYDLFGTYSHNNFVELLMSYGIVGFLIYYIPYYFLLLHLSRLARGRDLYAIFFLSYTIVHLGLGIGVVNYYERHTQLIIAAAWGYLVYRKNRTSYGQQSLPTPEHSTY